MCQTTIIAAKFNNAVKTSKGNGPGAVIPRWAISQGIDPDEVDRLIADASRRGVSDIAITNILRKSGCAVGRTTLRRRRMFLIGGKQAADRTGKSESASF